ncbi:MAG: MBL fold metallo-hydrolase [Desulfobacterales bacterium]
MYIKCWGSRGSIPVSGKNYLKYGGDTTCLEIRTKSDDIIIIDAGTGIRRLGNKLIEEERFRYNFLFTHAHWDHLLGFPFFKPIFFNNSELRIYRCPFPGTYAEKMISQILASPYFPGKHSAKIVFENGCPEQFEIGSITVIPIRLSHPNGGSGYKFIENGKSFVFLTDNELGHIHPGGLPSDDYLKFSIGADLLIHDAEYTLKEYETFIKWGHSSCADVIDLSMKAGIKELGLFHLNQERTDKEMDEIIKACRKNIAEKGYNFNCFAVRSDMTFNL